MPTSPQLSISLELEAGAEPIRGSVRGPGSEARPFWGWLQLIQAIEDVITNSQGGSHEDRHS
jgi:hypothetical protein